MTTQWHVPGYTELVELGSGGQGRVVLARDDEAGNLVAIKYLSPKLRSTAIFRREAQMLAKVDDPHVARLHAYVEIEAGTALVMEAVNGVTLRAVLGSVPSLAPEAALLILKGSLLGLAAAHTAGVVHRDYKPTNIMVQPDGTSKLIDFGIAVLAGTTSRAGTPAYMAPEQWRGEPASPATDVYAATCVFYECVTGRQPYSDATITLEEQHLTAPVPIQDLPDPLRPLVVTGMAKTPEARPATAQAFVTALENVATRAYGTDWETRGRTALKAAAAALAAATPLAALAVGAVHAPAGVRAAQSVISRILRSKATAAATAALAVGAVTAYTLWPTPPHRAHHLIPPFVLTLDQIRQRLITGPEVMGAKAIAADFRAEGHDLQAIKQQAPQDYPHDIDARQIPVCDRRWLTVSPATQIMRAGYGQYFDKASSWTTHSWNITAIIYPDTASQAADAKALANPAGPAVQTVAAPPSCPPDDGRPHRLDRFDYTPAGRVDVAHDETRHAEPADTIQGWQRVRITYTQRWDSGTFGSAIAWRRVIVQDICARGRVLLFIWYAASTKDRPSPAPTLAAAATALDLQLRRLNGEPLPTPFVTPILDINGDA